MITDSGDLLLTLAENGININAENGFFKMTGGFESAIILSLFGGNKEDNGNTGNKKTWWGNLDEAKPENKLISRTLNIITGLPATPANLILLSEAINQDLNWLIELKIIDTINVKNTIPAKNKVSIEVELLKDKKIIYTGKYEKNWQAMIK